jgi:hypothetical protein
LSFSKFKTLASSKLKFGFFMFTKLPSAWICGVRLREIDEGHAVVSVPYKWFSQNPFKSTYFACQAMAAEMSTGVLSMGHVYQRNPAVSLLVTKIEGVFLKKATSRIYFRCNDGEAILKTIDRAIVSGQGESITATSIGVNSNGEAVSEFKIEWSFKVRSN